VRRFAPACRLLAEHDFPRNHVLGGDNLSLWPIGLLAKRLGIVFIRRSSAITI
jgi:glycerol-3-phosphate O-acyltransferase